MKEELHIASPFSLNFEDEKQSYRWNYIVVGFPWLR